MLSMTCIYSIWAVLYLASVDDREYIPIREISEQMEIPFHFLTKILQLLAKADFVTTLRGAKGGVQLNELSTEISLRDVIEAIDGPEIFTDCILGLNECNDENPCPLHDKWTSAKNEIEKICEKTSFHDLSVKALNTRWINNSSIPGFRKMIFGK
jgi:Rrf2 family iron-sulfur cluster assembly transcriptional regulator